MELITREAVAEKLAAYLHHDLSLADQQYVAFFFPVSASSSMLPGGSF